MQRKSVRKDDVFGVRYSIISLRADLFSFGEGKVKFDNSQYHKLCEKKVMKIIFSTILSAFVLTGFAQLSAVKPVFIVGLNIP